jgi:hypothetical protein
MNPCVALPNLPVNADAHGRPLPTVTPFRLRLLRSRYALGAK